MNSEMRSFFRFYAVGAMGIGVQFAALMLLRRGLGLTVLLATAIAVEAAVLHNFLWHERWTWVDRGLTSSSAGWRFLRFNAGNGLISLGGNVAIMWLLVSKFHTPDLAANAAAIAACSLANFLISDRWVFRQ